MVTFPRRSTVKQGSDVTLVCVATPPLSRDVTRLFLPSAIKFFVNETLLRVPDCKARKRKIKICAVKLTNVTAKDSGTYSCQARNYRRCTYRRLKLRVVGKAFFLFLIYLCVIGSHYKYDKLINKFRLGLSIAKCLKMN